MNYTQLSQKPPSLYKMIGKCYWYADATLQIYVKVREQQYSSIRYFKYLSEEEIKMGNITHAPQFWVRWYTRPMPAIYVERLKMSSSYDLYFSREKISPTFVTKNLTVY